jgi:hypothetical protein
MNSIRDSKPLVAHEVSHKDATRMKYAKFNDNIFVYGISPNISNKI